MRRGITYLEAIKVILADGNPMSAQELVNEMRKRRLVDTSYETQYKTLHARLSVDIRKNGAASAFIRLKQDGRVLYSLRGFGTEQEYHTRRHHRAVSSRQKIVVFPAQRLDDVGHFHGVRKDFQQYEKVLLSPDNTILVNRLKAEADERYKQIVSYVVIKVGDSLLRFTRGIITNVGEYLHGEYSIGFGGHVEEHDLQPLFTSDSGYLNSVRRELRQEISLDLSTFPKYRLATIGVLNDDSTELGRHHFAFVQLLELLEVGSNPMEHFHKGEKSINNLQLVQLSQISKEFVGYEYWSKLCLQTFFSKHLSFECHVHAKTGSSLRKDADIILVVGYVGSGKTEACGLLAREFGYRLVPCSRILRSVLGVGAHERISRRRLQEMGLSFIQGPEGHARLAEAIVAFMRRHPAKKYVLDGLRYPQTLAALREILGVRIRVIYIESTVDNLHAYFSSRQRRGDQRRGMGSFLRTVYHPVEREIERFWPLADVTVYNHGPRTAYISALREFFEKELR
jgi:predicted NUDIX family phosphoesterase